MTSHTTSPPPTSTIPPRRVGRFGTVVVGAGQAGLAVAHYLAERDVDFAILSEESRVGDNWRRRWDSLRLFTPARYSGLPGMPFPAPPLHLPDKEEVADYLERYVQRFELRVRCETHVESVSRDGERYVLRAGRSTFEADNIVVATGAFQRSRVPALAQRLSADIYQLHSSDYKKPFELPDGPALVVGAGNSGAQIALELGRSRKVWLAGRDTGHLPRRLLGRDIFEWIWPLLTRATTDTQLGRRLRQRARRGGDALIGIPERALREGGVTRVGKVTEVRGGLPVCDGTALEPRVIVWCTGFVPDYRWIQIPVFGSDGYPRHHRGVVAEAPGLYFAGLRFQHCMASSLIGGVGGDAAFIAEQVAQRSPLRGVALTA
jgi:putative flavoprotein involved in K+ transport